MSKHLLLVIVFLSAAAHADGKHTRLDNEIREDFFDGFKGDAEALEHGMKRCEEILAKNPDEAEALVWHGSGLAFRAGQAFRAGNFKDGQAMFDRALTEVDRAVALRPDDAAVRVPRGALFLALSLNLPDPDKARAFLQKGVADYQAVEVQQRPYFDKLSVHARGQLLFGLADGFDRLGDAGKARTYYQRIVKETPTSPLAARAGDWLAGKPHSDKVTCMGCHVE